MTAGRQTFRIPAAAARQRGLPALGVELSSPAEIVIEPVATATTVVRCSERGPDGRALGELEVGVFAAALIIDRDGILENKAIAAATTAGDPYPAVALSLPGASGYRADIELRHAHRLELRYAYVLALASHDLGIDGGILITVRSAQPEWPAAATILESLRILTRNGTAKVANEDAEPKLPFIK